MITVLAGGVGAARFLRGLVEVVNPAEITAIINVADDFVIHGLYVCPDLDTVRSTLVDDVGPNGWGRAEETWNVMNELRVLGAGAPNQSRATDWFSLGDRDLAIHLYRTQRKHEGATLASITNELCDMTGVRSQLLPVSNDSISTRLTLRSGVEVDFQEYFVARRHSVAVKEIRFDGIESAKPADGVIEAITSADKVVIAPSNPLVSIAPVVDVNGVADALRARRDSVVAVSPIVGGRALKGPADRMLEELGFEPSVAGIAELWSGFAATLVVDDADAELADDVEARGMRCLTRPTVMGTTSDAAALAAAVIK